MNRHDYTAEAVLVRDTLSDIRIHIEGKTWHLWGRNGQVRELALSESMPEVGLPVLLGSGLGYCLASLLNRGKPVAVVDRETDIQNITKMRERFDGHPDVLWLDDISPRTTFDRLSEWQQSLGSVPFSPIIMPLYLRLDRAYYGVLADTLKKSVATDFRTQTSYPKFRNTTPRVLFLDSGYFLCGEILAALNKLSIPHRSLKLDNSPVGNQSFIESLLKAIVDFKPDFLLTVNHFGLDREGKLAGLLADLNIPLASWFVDNPHLILHEYAHPGAANTVMFTYDAGNLTPLRTRGFNHVQYLPLATDPERFKPGSITGDIAWKSDVAFVGNSMNDAVNEALRNADLPPRLRTAFHDVAAAFGASGEQDAAAFLKTTNPNWYAALESLPTPENRLALESLLTWEATRQYRRSCVHEILPFAPLIVGDEGWRHQLDPGSWRFLPPIDYYEDLPHFYPCARINFNCTSRQMIGAVNQRVFDVPACGAFVLTDHREQMEALFDLDKEAVVYRHPEEIADLVDRFIKDNDARKNVIKAARKRILAHHTYIHRLKSLLNTMRQTFA